MKVLGLEVRVKPFGKPVAKRINELKKMKLGSRLEASIENMARQAMSVASRWIGGASLLGPSVYEVRPTDDGWMIAERGSTLPLRVFPKKNDAVREARRMGRQHKADVHIFTKTGSLQSHMSFQA